MDKLKDWSTFIQNLIKISWMYTRVSVPREERTPI